MVKSVFIVSADSCKTPTFGYRIKQAFHNLGWKVDTFNYRKYQMHRFQISRDLINISLMSKVKEVEPSLILVLKGESIEKGVIKEFSDNGIKTVCWTLDDPFGEFSEFDEIKNRNEYDYFFVFDPYYLTPLIETGQPNSHYLPCAVDPALHREQLFTHGPFKYYDVSFVGSHSYEREVFLYGLIDYNIKLFGYRWKKKTKSWLYEKISNKIYHAHKSVNDLNETCKIFNETKINMNHHLIHSRAGLNLSTFEIPATNSFQLVDYFDELPNLFEIGKEIVCYKDIDEAKQLIDYYLKHPKERERIALAGHKRVIKDHTFTHRIKEMLEVIGE